MGTRAEGPPSRGLWLLAFALLLLVAGADANGRGMGKKQARGRSLQQSNGTVETQPVGGSNTDADLLARVQDAQARALLEKLLGQVGSQGLRALFAFRPALMSLDRMGLPRHLASGSWHPTYSNTLPHPQVAALTAKLESFNFDKNSSTVNFGNASIVASQVSHKAPFCFWPESLISCACPSMLNSRQQHLPVPLTVCGPASKCNPKHWPGCSC